MHIYMLIFTCMSPMVNKKKTCLQGKYKDISQFEFQINIYDLNATFWLPSENPVNTI